MMNASKILRSVRALQHSGRFARLLSVALLGLLATADRSVAHPQADIEPTLLTGCPDCPPLVLMDWSDNPTGWPSPANGDLPECLTPWEPGCFVGSTTDGDWDSIGILDGGEPQEQQEGQAQCGCIEFCLRPRSDGWLQIPAYWELTSVSGPFDCAQPPTDVCMGGWGGGTWVTARCFRVVVPWVDQDGDGEHYLEDDDEDKTPYGDDVTKQGLNDENGDGVPDGLQSSISQHILDDPGLLRDWVSSQEGFHGAYDYGVVEDDVERIASALEDSIAGGNVPQDLDQNGLVDMNELVQHLVTVAEQAITDLNQLGDSETFVERMEEFKRLQDTLEQYMDGSWAPNDHALEGGGRVEGLANAAPLSSDPVGKSERELLSATSGPSGQKISRYPSLATPNSLYYDPHPDAVHGLLNTLTANLVAMEVVNRAHAKQEREDPSVDAESGDPVRTANGEFIYRKTDLQIRGRGSLPLKVQRVYQSRHVRRGIFGYNWSAPILETHLLIWPEVNGVRTLEVSWGDGSRGLFRQNAPGLDATTYWDGVQGTYGRIRIYPSEYLQGGIESCSLASGGAPSTDIRNGLVARMSDGTEFFFCGPSVAPGSIEGLICHLRKVTDVHGNAVSVSRNRMGRPVRLVGTRNKTLNISYWPNGLVSEIADWTGRKWNYWYSEAEEDLVLVEYPETTYRDPVAGVGTARPYEAYEYHPSTDSDGGLVESAYLQHNLASVAKSSPFPCISIDYFAEPGPSFDRVSSVDSAGVVARYSYEQFDVDADITHVVTARFGDGETEIFRHRGGLLREHDILNGRFDAQGVLIPGSEEDGQGKYWRSLFEYNSDGNLIRHERGVTDVESEGRVTEIEYADPSVSPYRRGDVIAIRRLGSGGQGTGALERQIGHDPITGQVNRIMYEDGAESTATYAHYERSYVDVMQDPKIAGWGVLPVSPVSQAQWGKGDINSDGIIGGGWGRIASTSPAADVASPGGTSIVPESTGHLATRLYHRNAHGQITAEIDEQGIRREFFYFAGYLARVTSGAGTPAALVTYLRMNSLGELIYVREPGGANVHYRYDARGNRILESRIDLTTDPEPNVVNAGVWRESYFDLRGHYIGASRPFWGNGAFSVQGGGGKPIPSLLSYDLGGRLTSQEIRLHEGGGIVESGAWWFSYDGMGRISRIESPNGLVGTSEYSARGLQTRTTYLDPFDGGHAEKSWSYNHVGDLQRSYDPVGVGEATGLFQEFLTDGHGRVTGYRTTEGVLDTIQLDGSGRPSSILTTSATGQALREVALRFDGRGRLVERVVTPYRLGAIGDPVRLSSRAQVERLGYGKGHDQLLWSRLEGADGSLTLNHLTYDELGRLSGVFMGPGQEWGEQYTYDDHGRLQTVTKLLDGDGRPGPFSPSAIVSRRVYDDLGRVVAQELDGSIVGTFEYNEWSRVTKSIAPDGSSISYEYDGLGRLAGATTTGPEGAQREWSVSRDIEGAIVSVTTESGRTFALERDGYGRLRSRTIPGVGSEQTTYRPDGLLSSFRMMDGVKVECEYTDSGRLQEVQSLGAVTEVSQVFAYDALGQLVRATDTIDGESVVSARVLDSVGHVLDRSTSIPGWGERSFFQERDALGRVTQTRSPLGLEVDRTYDARSRLKTVVANQGHGVLAEFGAMYGRHPRSGELKWGLELAQEFDSQGRLLVRSLASPSLGDPAWGQGYAYDSRGNCNARTLAHTGLTEAFAFDEFERLQHWTIDGVGGVQGSQRTVDYYWSVSGDLELRQDSLFGDVDPTYDSVERLVSSAPVLTGVTFDGRGGEAARALADGGHIEFRHDGLGRPHQVRKIDSTGLVEAEYEIRHDGLGGIASWVETQANEGAAYWSLEGDVVRVEAIGSAFAPRAYVAGPYLRQPLARIESGQLTYVACDLLGSHTALLNGAGLVGEQLYDPFGTPRVAEYSQGGVSSGALFDRHYLGQPFFPGVEIHLLGARFYDSEHARFTSMDPLKEAGALNLISYPGQNPLRWADPFGLEGTEVRQVPGDICYYPEDTFEIVQGESFAGFMRTAYGVDLDDPNASPQQILDALRQGHKEQTEFLFELPEDGGPIDEAQRAEVERSLEEIERQIFARGGAGAFAELFGERRLEEMLDAWKAQEENVGDVASFVPIVGGVVEANRDIERGASAPDIVFNAGVGIFGGKLLGTLVKVVKKGAGKARKFLRPKPKALKGGKSFENFKEFKKEKGGATDFGGDGQEREWHHIVEQNQGADRGGPFTLQEINNSKNLVAMTTESHRKLNGLLQTKNIPDGAGGMTTHRAILDGLKGFDKKFNYMMELMEDLPGDWVGIK